MIPLYYIGYAVLIFIFKPFLIKNFYNIKSLDIGLWRYANDIRNRKLRTKTLPLQKGTLVYFSDLSTLPDFGGRPAGTELHFMELLTRTATSPLCNFWL